MLIDAVERAQQLREEIPHLIQPSQADYDRVCLLTEVETLRAEVSALRLRVETAEKERDLLRLEEDGDTLSWATQASMYEAEIERWRNRVETAEKDAAEALYMLEKAEDDAKALYLLSEAMKKERDEAYAKGQRDTITAVKGILDGVDREEMDHDGWWETSVGAEFGAKKLAEILALPIKERP